MNFPRPRYEIYKKARNAQTCDRRDSSSRYPPCGLVIIVDVNREPVPAVKTRKRVPESASGVMASYWREAVACVLPEF